MSETLTPAEIGRLRELVDIASAVANGEAFRLPGVEPEFRAIVLEASQLAEYEAIARRLNVAPPHLYAALLTIGGVFLRGALDQQVEVPDGAAVN